jgi:hypothetical protein
MNDRSSEQRPVKPLNLTPTDTIRTQWIRDKGTEFQFDEYRLNGRPDSLKSFVVEFLMFSGRYDYDKDLLIWTSENSFARVGGYCCHGFPRAYENHRFELELTSGSHCHSLYIHSTTLEDAMSCFDFLVGLHDDHFDKMELCKNYTSGEDEDNGPQLCPFTTFLLQKIIQQNAKRKYSFAFMTFTLDQCRTLATSGTRTDIELYGCKFQDDGEAFLEALAAREDPETGLAKLRFASCLPFAEGILVLLLHMLKCLSLHNITLETEETCRAVAEAELQYLELDHCKLGDDGASLVESVRVGRGPKGLGLDKESYDEVDEDEDEDDWSPFDSSKRFISFMDALRSNSHLERLDLSGIGVGAEGILDALAASMLENKGLIYLGVQHCRSDKSLFCELLRAISAHPSLRTLDLSGVEIEIGINGVEATTEVAKMLSDNKQIEKILIFKDFQDFDDSPFDSTTWDKLVTPRLECNVYRKRFLAIRKYAEQSTRAAVMARALSHVSNRPSLAFMLLRQNSDILSIYPLTVDPQIVTLSGKRSRSPSSDGRGVSNLGSGNWT